MVDPLRRVVMRHRPQGDSAPLDVVSCSPSDGCNSNNMEEWTAFIYAYKAALLGVGCFVAWNIRRRSTGLAFSMSAVAAVSVAGAAARPQSFTSLLRDQRSGPRLRPPVPCRHVRGPHRPAARRRGRGPRGRSYKGRGRRGAQPTAETGKG
nr:gamma-aminobutyric acid type B receptor subunit 2-like [Nerophis lumbriciformis]